MEKNKTPINNAPSDPSRRRFLTRELPTILGAVFMFGGTGYEISHMFGGDHHEELSHEEQESRDRVQEGLKAGDQDSVAQELEKHPKERRQVILDAAMVVLFGTGVLSKFFSENFSSASLNMFLSVLAVYLPLSTPESRKKFKDIMKSAFGGGGVIMTLAQVGESFSINTDDIFSQTLRHKYQNGLNEFYKDGGDIKVLLNSMNIYVDTTETYGQNVYLNDHIYISPSLFFKLLQVIVANHKSDTLDEKILYTIQRHTNSIDVDKEIHNIIEKREDGKLKTENGKHHQEVSFDNTLTQEVNAYTLDLINHEIRGVAMLFYLTQFPLFGVGQAAVFKKKMHSIAHLLEKVALSNGKTAYDAAIIKSNLLALMTSYLPNRMAHFSDIGPNTGAFQEAGAEGVWVLFKEQLPIATASGISFITILRQICDSALPAGKEYFSEGEEKQSDNQFQTIIAPAKNFVLSLARGLSDFGHQVSNVTKNVADLIEDLENGKKFSDISRHLSFDSTNNEAVRKYILRNQKSLSKDKHSLVERISKSESKTLAQSLLTALRNSNKRLPKNIRGTLNGDDTITFVNLLELTEFIKGVTERYRDTDTEKQFLKVMYGNEDFFMQLMSDLHENHIHPEIEGFLREHFKEEEEFTLEDIAEALYNQETLSPEIPGISDFNFARKKNITIQGSLKGNVYIIHKNIKFLMFGKQNNYTLADEYTTNFVENCRNLAGFFGEIGISDDTTSKDIFLGGLTERLSPEEIDFFNAIFGENTVHEDSAYKNSGVKDGTNKSQTLYLEKPSDSKKGLSQKLGKAFGTLRGEVLDFTIPGSSVTIRKIRSWYEEGYDTLKHKIEQHIGMNSWEVFQMIFLLQSPFVNAVKSTIERMITTTVETCEKYNINVPNSVIETCIATATYSLSMFADNYIGLIVGSKLCQDILGYTPTESIKKMAKFSVYGGSMVITGNAPNPLIALQEKWFNIYETMPEAEKEKIILEHSAFKTKVRKLSNPSDYKKRLAYKKQSSIDANSSKAVDIIMDVTMLSLMNSKAWGKVGGLIMLGTRGDQHVNSFVGSIINKCESLLLNTLGGMKMMGNIGQGRAKK